MPVSEVYNEDCLIGMKRFPDNFFDVSIVDPPYGSKNIIGGYSSGNGGGIAKATKYQHSLWKFPPPDKVYFEELFRVSKNQIIWGANHFIENIPKANSSCWVVWDKDNGDVSFSDCELAWTSFHQAVRRFKFRWHGMLQGDMKNKEIRIHESQKPVQLYKWLLDKFCYPGDKILDTHMGSQSSRIAAHQLEFDYWGMELDEIHFNDGCNRFKEQTLQLSLQFPK